MNRFKQIGRLSFNLRGLRGTVFVTRGENGVRQKHLIWQRVAYNVFANSYVKEMQTTAQPQTYEELYGRPSSKFI